MQAVQLGLLGGEEPAFDPHFSSLERTELAEGAWVDYAPGWVSGHGRLFDALASQTRWRTYEETLYDRTLPAPRLIAMLPEDGPGHPLLELIRTALSQRYGEAFPRLSLALYRNGRDSVAFHGDRVARTLPSALVATLSLGSPRRFQLRPRGGGRSLGWKLGWGDLIVMGGSCQRTWQHAIPKVAHADPRIAVMFRPQWEPPEPASEKR
jgi:alkylated DNA repair dioxygenase AlkB